jgi:hypothetical protein
MPTHSFHQDYIQNLEVNFSGLDKTTLSFRIEAETTEEIISAGLKLHPSSTPFFLLCNGTILDFNDNLLNVLPALWWTLALEKESEVFPQYSQVDNLIFAVNNRNIQKLPGTQSIPISLELVKGDNSKTISNLQDLQLLIYRLINENKTGIDWWDTFTF